jgi:hypothetical protein
MRACSRLTASALIRQFGLIAPMRPPDQARSPANRSAPSTARREPATAARGFAGDAHFDSIGADRQPDDVWRLPFWPSAVMVAPGPASSKHGLRSGRCCAGFIVCDKAAPSAAVVLHLRARYVSKAAILGLPGQIVPVKNRSLI